MMNDPEIATDSARKSAADFRPTASWQNLRLRADLLRKMREFFYDRGFLEVETPLASADVVVDRHLDPLSVVLPNDPRQPNIGRRLWLQTSPEFAMKRLLAAGAPAIYQIAKAFRADEIGALHNPEFTIVEWYRPGDDMAAGMKFLSDLCEALLGRVPAQRLSYADAFQQHVGLDPHRASLAELRTAADALDLSAPASLGDDRDGWLDFLMTERIHPHLGINQPDNRVRLPGIASRAGSDSRGRSGGRRKVRAVCRRRRTGQRLPRATGPRGTAAAADGGQRSSSGRRPSGIAGGKSPARGDGCGFALFGRGCPGVRSYGDDRRRRLPHPRSHGVPDRPCVGRRRGVRIWRPSTCDFTPSRTKAGKILAESTLQADSKAIRVSISANHPLTNASYDATVAEMAFAEPPAF